MANPLPPNATGYARQTPVRLQRRLRTVVGVVGLSWDRGTGGAGKTALSRHGGPRRTRSP